MTAKPGFIYSGTEWVQIGAEPNTTPVKIQSTAPTSPQTGDIWVDTSEYIPTTDSSVMITQAELDSSELLSYIGL